MSIRYNEEGILFMSYCETAGACAVPLLALWKKEIVR